MDIVDILIHSVCVLALVLVGLNWYLDFMAWLDKKRNKKTKKEPSLAEEINKLINQQHANDCAHYNNQLSTWAKDFIEWIHENDASREEIIESLNNLADKTEQESALWVTKKILNK